ncbi:hypothetical protein N7509_009746 [Penicillium cosmopolitanum]|uniref:Chitin-binding type-1 domain-containing protein n=1 Tax=Penicillium cosmopolitanum TaxID=1131564 RepID=A0A9W9VQ65_9EURO|nr:uncharacterized protein N7509_009746 [Penicillium cosmopolitanum]KAJ5387205.1 hypothetical protein N7509_009746 [Penicillium cosmopolitanum]
MRFISFTLTTLMASASMVMAAPADSNGAAAKWTCPNGWKYCGCVGNGGGDGALCGSGGFGDQVCPVKK